MFLHLSLAALLFALIQTPTYPNRLIYSANKARWDLPERIFQCPQIYFRLFFCMLLAYQFYSTVGGSGSSVPCCMVSVQSSAQSVAHPLMTRNVASPIASSCSPIQIS